MLKRMTCVYRFMAGKDRFGNEFRGGIYADIRSGEVYSFERDKGDCYFGPAWLGSPLEAGVKRGILLSDGDALMRNFVPIIVKKEHERDFLEIVESL